MLADTDHDSGWHCQSMWTSENQPRNMIFATRRLISLLWCVPLLVRGLHMRDLPVLFDSLNVHGERSVNDSSVYSSPLSILHSCCNSRLLQCVNPIKTFHWGTSVHGTSLRRYVSYLWLGTPFVRGPYGVLIDKITAATQHSIATTGCGNGDGTWWVQCSPVATGEPVGRTLGFSSASSLLSVRLNLSS